MIDKHRLASDIRVKWVVASAGLLIVLVLLTELLGAVLCFLQTGRVVYTAPGSAPAQVTAPTRPSEYQQRLHPYFGFTAQYSAEIGSLQLHTNSLGFLQRERLQVPYPAAPSDFIVVVFGGSVAQHVVIGPRAAPPLRDVLQGLPSLAGKNVVVIDMAQGSGKQPQQLLELSYLLAAGQRIDCVVNVDGFNEFALGYQSYLSDLDPILPAVQIMRPLAVTLSAGVGSPEYYDLAARVLSARRAVDVHFGSLRTTRTGIGYFQASILLHWNKLILARSTASYEQQVVRARDWSDLKARFGLDLPAPKSEIFGTIFDLWLRSSQQMKVLAEANNAIYVHVVQPNQFFSRHSFTEQERQIALSLPADHEYRRGVAGGYRLLQERRPVLASNGIVSAVELFDAEPGEVYDDPCCHYTGAGMTLFTQFVAKEIGRHINKTN